MSKIIDLAGSRFGWRGALVLPDEYFESAPAGVTASADITEAAQTASSSSLIAVTCDAAITETSQTAAASSSISIVSTASIIELGDSLTALASVEGSEETAQPAHGFVITDTAPRLWWQRKPKAMPEEVAERHVKRIAGTIERIASKQAAPTKAARKEIIQAIQPQLEQMPGFDWLPVYQAILLGLHIRRGEESQRQAEQLAWELRQADDLLVLLLAA